MDDQCNKWYSNTFELPVPSIDSWHSIESVDWEYQKHVHVHILEVIDKMVREAKIKWIRFIQR